MFRTKGAVDRHVLELFRKVSDEKERKVRSYYIAKLYYEIHDYESARQYIIAYLEVKNDSAPAHKLLGEILEDLGHKQAALAQYRSSLTFNNQQDDVLLKVCKLLIDPEISFNTEHVKYYISRASERFPDHPIIFQLKERLLFINGGDLESLITSELSLKPWNVQLRVKLIKYYVSKQRFEYAYQYAMDVEKNIPYRDSLLWYETLSTFLQKYKESKSLQQWSFWMLYLSSLERVTALTLKEQGILIPKTVCDATEALFNFDQALTESKIYHTENNSALIEHVYNHMFGQLNYHLACLIFRKTKKEQGSWSEAEKLCAPLLLAAIHCMPIDPSLTRSSMQVGDRVNDQLLVWYREAAYRCSQAGHVLQDYAHDNTDQLLDKIVKFCVGSWKERVYLQIFSSQKHIAFKSNSFFANNKFSSPPLRLLTYPELKKFDEISEQVNPSSLHHHIWLGIANQTICSISNQCYTDVYLEGIYCHVFPHLQLSPHNLKQAAPNSLGKLDVDAFLNAIVFCSSAYIHDREQQKNSSLSPDRLPTLPADLTNTLCTTAQDKWWSSAYKIYLNNDTTPTDHEICKLRHELHLGLEIVRCIGNNILHPCIMVHLAKMFQHRANRLEHKDKSHTDLPFLEARYELYWSKAIQFHEQFLNNETIIFKISKFFDYQGKNTSSLELQNALEDGRLTLAKKLVKEKQCENTMYKLLNLKSPAASFIQGDIYRKLADELIESTSNENLTSAIRSQQAFMLTKARNCYYLTLNRLTSPSKINQRNHLMISELSSKIQIIENDLNRIDPDWKKNDCDDIENPEINQGNSSSISPSDLFTNDQTEKESAEAHASLEHESTIRTIIDQFKCLQDSGKELLESNNHMRDKIEELCQEMVKLRSDANDSGSRPLQPLSSGFPIYFNNQTNPHLPSMYPQSPSLPTTSSYRQKPHVSFSRDTRQTSSMYSPDILHHMSPMYSTGKIDQTMAGAQHLLSNQSMNRPMGLLDPSQGGAANLSMQLPTTTDTSRIINPTHNQEISMPLNAISPTTVVIPSFSSNMTYTTSSTTAETDNKVSENNPSILSTTITPHSTSSIEAVEVKHDPIPNFQSITLANVNVTVTTGEDEKKFLPAREQQDLHILHELREQQDLHVLHELKVSPEERQAAIKLQLPENFYSYKYKENCPGCLGCEKAEATIFPSTFGSEILASDKNVDGTTKQILRTISNNTLTNTSSSFAGNSPSIFASPITVGQSSPKLPALLKEVKLASNLTCSSSTKTPPTMSGENKGDIFAGKGTVIEDEKENTIPAFLTPANEILTFSALATKEDQPIKFKTDPNFTFAGAGQSVFGSRKPANASKSSLQSSTRSNEIHKNRKEEEEEEEGGNDDKENDHDNDDKYDPHYEPVVPLPDTIEVKTGEEDEEKVFSHRAKLYRYESETREWKERGTGEMKLLHHVQQGRYRLLLRREQVHKAVCNMSLSSDFELSPLNTSDRAWLWAGSNYAEETPVVEKLAVKFITPGIAMQFKNAVEMAKKNLCSMHSKSIQDTHEEEKKEMNDCHNGDDNEDEDEDSDEDVSDEDVIVSTT